MKKLPLLATTVLATLTLSTSLYVQSARVMEPVLTISAANARALLLDDHSPAIKDSPAENHALTGNTAENVILIDHIVAAELLGDKPKQPFYDASELNNLPHTAAGNDSIIYINAEAARDLLND
ncbi:MAG: hypothetical protein KUG79_00995 [Pseudomonadales bacterium]|nr:hypothetical protein [Pseudomonadales bacterium]